MSDVAIKVEGLSKQYRLGARAPYRRLTETLNDALTAPFRLLSGGTKPPRHEGTKGDAESDGTFWALKDVSFEIKKGEVVGIIGRNGAGKSTLLKILSRITEPTHGDVWLHGRVGSLLEVGTGFHPELSGRENIFLNGAILGMKRWEIQKKFDEIVAFSETEKFLDTPVKHYSSGMYMRLAFAVAAHLEPEILLVDEVLAVGDAQFQKKCMGKMGEVAKQGRTVLFVSHNMQAVRALCRRCVMLEQGSTLADGDPVAVTSQYQSTLNQVRIGSDTAVFDTKFRRGSGAVRMNGITVEDEGGTRRLDFAYGQTIRFRLPYVVFADVAELWVAVVLRGGVGDDIITTARFPISDHPLTAGCKGVAVIDLPRACLRPGEYPLYLWLGDSLANPYDVVDGLVGPLTIVARGSLRELGFDPAQRSGYFSIDARLVSAD